MRRGDVAEERASKVPRVTDISAMPPKLNPKRSQRHQYFLAVLRKGFTYRYCLVAESI
jgi:hypothetical protein